jgi:hypothetical protein
MIPPREHLVGYLLGALEPAERDQVEVELDRNPQLRLELARLEACLGHLGMDERPEHFVSPPGLAARTCRLVAGKAEPQITKRAALASLGAAPYGADSRRRYSWSDVVVAACVLVAAASIFFPALSHSRGQAQMATCQNNLRYIGYGQHERSDRHPSGEFVIPEASGNRSAAGAVAAQLVADQFVPGPTVFLCAGSPRDWSEEPFYMPTMDELDRAMGEMLARHHRVMGGDYGFNLGYFLNDRLMRPGRGQPDDYVLASDAPSNRMPGRRTANHNGRGQNVLYKNGSVRFIVIIPSPQLPDDPFHNRDGRVAAGLDLHDAVLGASPDRPIPVQWVNGR